MLENKEDESEKKSVLILHIHKICVPLIKWFTAILGLKQSNQIKNLCLSFKSIKPVFHFRIAVNLFCKYLFEDIIYPCGRVCPNFFLFFCYVVKYTS